jgi:hypothetical protein
LAKENFRLLPRLFDHYVEGDVSEADQADWGVDAGYYRGYITRDEHRVARELWEQTNADRDTPRMCLNVAIKLVAEGKFKKD